jgi:hypothetical protein
MSTLYFAGKTVREVNPKRMVYTATDRFGYIYTIGLDFTGARGFAAVYDPVTLVTVHSRTCFDHRIHVDELKRHLQKVADLIEAQFLVTDPVPSTPKVSAT